MLLAYLLDFLQALQFVPEMEALKGPWAYFMHSSMNETLPPDELVVANIAKELDAHSSQDTIKHILPLSDAEKTNKSDSDHAKELGLEKTKKSDTAVQLSSMVTSDFLQSLVSSIVPSGLLHDLASADIQDLFAVPGLACTGIIAQDSDGSVYHARNLDIGPGTRKNQSFAHWYQNITFNGVFTKGGKEIFTGQMTAISPLVLTGIRRGPNGYSTEINTRWLDHGVQAVMEHLFKEHREPSGWLVRKVMENNVNYEDAVQAMSNAKFASPLYILMSGVKKGVILAHDPDSLAYKLEFGKKRYIIMTNYDYISPTKHKSSTVNSKAWLDTVELNGFGQRQRLAADTIMNASKNVTAELLHQALNDKAVISSETIFQAIINVEKDMYKSTLPHCLDC